MASRVTNISKAIVACTSMLRQARIPAVLYRISKSRGDYSSSSVTCKPLGRQKPQWVEHDVNLRLENTQSKTAAATPNRSVLKANLSADQQRNLVVSLNPLLFHASEPDLHRPFVRVESFDLC